MNPPREDGMPFMLTEAQKRELRALGYTEEEILHIVPEEGHRIIAEQCKAHDWRERKAFEKKRDEDFPEDDKPKSRPEGEDATPLPEDGLDFADFAREQAEAAKSGRKPRLRIVELHGAFDLLASRIELTPNGPFDKKLLERLAEFRRERPEEFARLCERYPAVQAAIASLDVIAAGFEDKVALEFSALYANVLRYVADWKKWLQWDGVRWRVENTLHAYDLARVLCRAAKYAAAKTVAAVISHARADRRQAATVEQWDADIWKLGTPAGTVDLRTGKLSAPSPLDYITKITAVAPSDKPPRDSCPMFLTFINRVTDGNEELQDYLQRVCGYCLTGDTTEDALFFHYGKGQNGKSVFLDTVSGILSDYHEAADMELFIVTHGEKHPTDLASLRGARLVTAVETEEGKRWAESKLKQMTGGDPIKARFMRQDFFTYIPQFKLMFAANHKPAIRNVDVAISRRFHLMPWLVTIPENERNKKLSDELKAEWPGILRWMIDGCLMWQREGLRPPKIVTDATETYLQSQDDLQRFLDECCAVAKNERDSIEHIWDGWTDWANDCGEFVGSKRRLGDRLEDKGFERVKGTRGVREYLGLRCMRENAKKLREQARASNSTTTAQTTNSEPGISARRIQELADWYADEAHHRHNGGSLDAAVLDAELRAILREEVASPEQVEAAFERIMRIVFAT